MEVLATNFFRKRARHPRLKMSCFLFYSHKVLCIMMNNILVHYPKSNSKPVSIDYKISVEGDLKTISCAVADKDTAPAWLELLKFELVAMKFDQSYDLVFENKKFDRNLDTVLFMDKVFENIMEIRRLDRKAS